MMQLVLIKLFIGKIVGGEPANGLAQLLTLNKQKIFIWILRQYIDGLVHKVR